MKKYCIIFGLLLLPFFQLRAQYFLTGQEPASAKWMQLINNEFRIIFPKGQEDQARQYAAFLSVVKPVLNADLDAPGRFTNLVLHHQSVVSNASTAWAPRRLDFFHTVPQDSYSQSWPKQLSIHELRHLAQFSAMEKGFGKVAHWIGGQQLNAGIFGIFVPLWFAEGDAVLAETRCSFSGRGRQALFLAGLQAQLHERGPFAYNKAYFGSYKDYVPNVYELGYAIVAYGNARFGDKLWANALDFTARKPWTLTPFSSGIKAISGFSKKQLYNEFVRDFSENFDNQIVKYDSVSSLLIKQKEDYMSYRSPKVLADGSVVAIKRNLGDIPALVRISQNGEQLLLYPGILLHDWITARDSLMLWAEFENDLRWSNRNYSVLKMANLRSGQVKQISSKTKLFAPALSPQSDCLAAIEQLDNGKTAIVLLELPDGIEVYRLESDSTVFLTPCWHPNGKQLLFAELGEKGKAIAQINLQTKETELISPFTFTNFQLSEATEEGVLLYGDWSGKSCLYLFRFDDRQLVKLFEPRFAAADPAYSHADRRLVFSDYSATGLKLKKIDAKQRLTSAAFNFASKANFPLADTLTARSVFNMDTARFKPDSSAMRPYRRLAHLFEVHSWAPIYIDANNQGFAPGLSLFSQNALSTMLAALGFRWDESEQTGRYEASLTYLGLYPELRMSAGHGLRRAKATVGSTTYDLKWKESDWGISAGIPFNLNRGQWIRGIRPETGFSQSFREMEPGMALEFQEKSVSSLKYSLLIYSQRRLAHRDIFPKYGIIAQMVYRHRLCQIETSSQIFAGGIIYLPGFAKHHGFRFYLATQQNRSKKTSFQNLIASPRGNSSHLFDEQVVAKIDYLFPIAYPDWSISSLSYFKRLSGRFFYDLQNGQNENINTFFSSAGAELHSEWHFFNFPAPFDIGLRFIYINPLNKMPLEFLFGINFDALY